MKCPDLGSQANFCVCVCVYVRGVKIHLAHKTIQGDISTLFLRNLQ